MKIELYEIKDLPELDYGGWETVDFDKMEHYFDDGVNPKCTRALQRRSEHDWVFENDWGQWENFDMGCGETEVLEEYYQAWISLKE